MPKAKAVQLTEAEIAQLKSTNSNKRRGKSRPAAERPRRQPPSFAIIPYDGANGTRRRPIYIECGPDRVTIEPEGIVLTIEDFAGPDGPGNPLATVLRAVRDDWPHMARREAQRRTLSVADRPAGRHRLFYSARQAMASWASEFGYELVEQNRRLAYPPSIRDWPTSSGPPWPMRAPAMPGSPTPTPGARKRPAQATVVSRIAHRRRRRSRRGRCRSVRAMASGGGGSGGARVWAEVAPSLGEARFWTRAPAVLGMGNGWLGNECRRQRHRMSVCPAGNGALPLAAPALLVSLVSPRSGFSASAGVRKRRVAMLPADKRIVRQRREQRRRRRRQPVFPAMHASGQRDCRMPN